MSGRDSLAGLGCFALLDDCGASAERPTSRLYTGFRGQHVGRDADDLERVWLAVDAELRAGGHAVLLCDYEFGGRLLGVGRPPAADAAALRFLIFSRLDHLSRPAVDDWLAGIAPPAPAGCVDLRFGVDAEAFHRAVAEIQTAIGNGETYQVNFTTRIDFRAFGSPLDLYRRLRARQPVAYGAFLQLPEGSAPSHVLSCSPELFLRHRGGIVTARPMKGTAAGSDDPAAAERLRADAKNRAENLMIVDLLRNDLGRVAATGSVRVPALFSVEACGALWQMTSTIEARLPAATSLPQLWRALFPCGSIVGAPKHHTMELIAGLETTPRGLYTGAIGWFDAPPPEAPAGACGDFCCSVAIRTVTLDAAPAGELQRGRLGVGAGIVADSRAADEFEECRLKATFLTGLDPGFALIETMFATRQQGIRHCERHLARLRDSATTFGFAFDGAAIDAALAACVADLDPAGPARLRLSLDKSGRLELAATPLRPLPAGPVDLPIADTAIATEPFLLRHKTTWRRHYDAAVAAAEGAGAFDTLFINAAGEITEGGRSNVFVRLDGRWWTPPAAAGLLPGVMRAALLADPTWQAAERRLRPADLYRAEAIVVCNALRGALPARLAGAVYSRLGKGGI